MQFNDTSTKKGILQMIEQVTNLGDAAITGTAVKLAYFTNLVNQWAMITHQYIRQVSNQWHYDDSNYTTFPVSYTTIVNGQRDYTLDSTMQRVRQVEVMGANGKYYSLQLMSKDDLKNEKWQETSGKPSHYYMVGRAVMLYPAPDTAQVTAVAGLRVTHDRKLDLFATTDTTQEPGFDEPYHWILVYGAAHEWAMTNGNQGVAELSMMKLGGFEGLSMLVKKHYSSRNDDDPAVITRDYKSYK